MDRWINIKWIILWQIFNFYLVFFYNATLIAIFYFKYLQSLLSFIKLY